MTSRHPSGDEPQGALWIAEVMWELGCVQFGDFSVGRTVRNSPVYLNPKLLVSRPEALTRVADLVRKHGQLRLAGAMLYDAQVAGLGDRNPFKRLMNPAASVVRSRSLDALAKLRREVASALGPLAAM